MPGSKGEHLDPGRLFRVMATRRGENRHLTMARACRWADHSPSRFALPAWAGAGSPVWNSDLT